MKLLACLALLALFPQSGTAIENGALVKDTAYIQVGRFWRDDVPCTGTLVGPRVFVTAAHCAVALGLQTRGAFELGGPGLPIDFTVEVHYDDAIKSPDYPAPGTGANDLAVGILAEPIVGVSPIAIETEPLAVGEKVVLAGWGDPHENYLLRAAPNVVGRYVDGFMEVGPMNGGGVAEPGDSGGPVLVTRNGKLRIAGVIRGNAAQTTGTTAFSNPLSLSFLRKVIAERKVSICGLNLSCE